MSDETRTIVVTVDVEGYDLDGIELSAELGNVCVEYLKARLPATAGAKYTVQDTDVTALLEELGE